MSERELTYYEALFDSCTAHGIEWYENQELVLALAHFIMDSEDPFEGIDTVLYFFEKPYKWHGDFVRFIELQSAISAGG